MGETFRERFGMKGKSGHAHVEPWAWARCGGAEEHVLEIWRVEHRAHVGERRAGLFELFGVPFDVSDELFGLRVIPG